MKLLIMISFQLFSYFSYSNSSLIFKNRDFVNVQDSLGIPIAVVTFDSLVDNLLTEFKSEKNKKTISDYLTFIRVVNTIGFDNLIDKKKNYKEAYFLFFQKYLEQVVEITQARESKGFSYHSIKYNILIGGYKTANNFYRIKYK